MKKQFEDIIEQLGRGEPACLEIHTDDSSYLRDFQPRERLLLLGGGHIALHLCRLASWLGFSVSVADDRPSFANRTRFPEADAVLCGDFEDSVRKLEIRPGDYVAVMTRGHRYDAECLRTILSGTMPRYIGMIASRRRGIGLLRLLEEEGFEKEKLEQIHTPIGLDINALTLEEIAVSIAAELVQCRRKNTKRHSKSERLTQTDINPELLHFIAEDPSPKVLLIVCQTEGSTPVKSGAMMAMDRAMRTVGTIGGGCGEGAAMREAFRLIGTGGQKLYTVDLNNDIAAEEGMVCGGRMRIFMADIS